MTLQGLLDAGLPYRMAEDLAAPGDAAFVADMVARYLAADDDGQADMAAFHDSDGVEKIEEARRIEEGLE